LPDDKPNSAMPQSSISKKRIRNGVIFASIVAPILFILATNMQLAAFSILSSDPFIYRVPSISGLIGASFFAVLIGTPLALPFALLVAYPILLWRHRHGSMSLSICTGAGALTALAFFLAVRWWGNLGPVPQSVAGVGELMKLILVGAASGAAYWYHAVRVSQKAPG
jgi:hypothetical protein